MSTNLWKLYLVSVLIGLPYYVGVYSDLYLSGISQERFSTIYECYNMSQYPMSYDWVLIAIFFFLFSELSIKKRISHIVLASVLHAVILLPIIVGLFPSSLT